jgi:hypothetical protein
MMKGDLVDDAPGAHEKAMELYAEIDRLHTEVEGLLKLGWDRQQSKIVLRDGPGRGPGRPLEDHPGLGATRAALERARQRFDPAWAIYLEAARARDVKEANALAESNNAVASANRTISGRIVWLTFVLAATAIVQVAATVIQLVHTWGKQP